MRKCNACRKQFKDLDKVAEHIMGQKDEEHKALYPWVEKYRAKKASGEVPSVLKKVPVPEEVPGSLIRHKNGKVKKDALLWARELAKRGKIEARLRRLEASRRLKCARLLVDPALYEGAARLLLQGQEQLKQDREEFAKQVSKRVESLDRREQAIAKKEKG